MARIQKEERLHFRVTTHQKNIIVRAAEIKGITMTDFILEAAYQSASQIISDQVNHQVPADKWAIIQNALNAPAKEILVLSQMVQKYGHLLASDLEPGQEPVSSATKRSKAKLDGKSGVLRKKTSAQVLK